MGWWENLTKLAWWPAAVEYEYKRLGLGSKPYPQPSLLIEVPQDEMRDIIVEAGIRPEVVWWTDGAYWTAPKSDFEGWLAHDDINKQTYQKNKYDCDNFAHDLVTFAIRWVKGLAIGEIWYTQPSGTGHAVNIYVDSAKKVWVYEPQSDRLTDVDFSKVHYMRL